MLKVRLNLRKVVAIAICLAVTTMFSGCGNENDDEKYLTCDDIRSSGSTFTMLNVTIGHSNADYLGYARLEFRPNGVDFIVAESEKNSKSQTFIFKNVPDVYLENIITNYCEYVEENGIWIFKPREGYKRFDLISLNGLTNSELQNIMQNINISNQNTKIAIIPYGYITIYAKGQMWSPDGAFSRTQANMYPSETLECGFNVYGSHLVYSDSDCDITGNFKYGDWSIKNLDIRLRKGWNKVFDFGERIITTDDVQDSHLIWNDFAG